MIALLMDDVDVDVVVVVVLVAFVVIAVVIIQSILTLFQTCIYKKNIERKIRSLSMGMQCQHL